MNQLGTSTRTLLLPLSGIYRLIVQIRNKAFDSRGGIRVPAPVISIGNITAGGTGKTPFVIEICRRLIDAGRKPAILTRGYGARAGETADEVLEFRAALPQTPVVVDSNRVRGAARAVNEFAADILVMDDGFQHRRLARVLDIVLIDALDSFGGGHLLPAGRLREPLKNLRRANLLVISRANQVPTNEVAQIERRLADYGPGVPVIRANMKAAPAAELPARTIGACGLGNPASFRQSLQALRPGASVITFRDHHCYTPRDVDRLISAATAANATAVTVSRKDWVKLQPIWPRETSIALHRLDMHIEIVDPAGALDHALTAVLPPSDATIPRA